MTRPDDLRAAMDRIFAEVLGTLDQPPPDAGPLPTITVHKYSSYLMLSVDQQLDAGLITEEQARAQGWTPYVAPPVPLSRRLRWRWQAWRERTGRKIGGWVAGVDLSGRDEDW
jgi:hypothetical protein